MLELLINLFSNAVKDIIRSRLVAALAALKVKNEDHYKVVMSSLYPVVDVELEDITDKTKTKADDVVVDAIKEAMEQSAKDNGITLQNLDSD